MNRKKEESNSYSFVSEKIKTRPINKTILLRKTLSTLFAAILFGGVACFTFLLLEPIISNQLNPEEITKVELPEIEEEMAPEELLTEDMVAEEEQSIKQDEISARVEEEVSSGKIAMKTYQTIYEELYAVYREATHSMLIVNGVSEDTDWFQNSIENVNETSGVVLMKTEDKIYIVADINGLPNAEEYLVSYKQTSGIPTTLVQKDSETGVAVFAVDINAFSKMDQDKMKAIPLGSSQNPNISGRPVIALGSPFGQSEGVCYGVITSTKGVISYADHDYNILTTDIMGRQNNASGVIIDTSGKLLGIITKKSNEGAGMLLACYGISDIYDLIGQLTNNEMRPYVGILGKTVTDEIHENLKIPYGVYVSDVESDSPSMMGGIVNGDVIVSIDGKEIHSMDNYEEVIQALNPDNTALFEVERYNGKKYVKMTVEIRPDNLNEL